MRSRLARKILKAIDEEDGRKQHPLGYWGTRNLIGKDHRVKKALGMERKS